MPLLRGGKLSGMQRDVLSLYRSFLRETQRRAEESPSDADRLKQFVQAEFRRCAQVDKKEYQTIEYLLRKGAKQLQQLQDSSTTGFNLASRP